MRIIRRIPNFIACLLLAGCASTGGSYEALFSSPDSLAGQNVTACGFLQYEFENVNFYPNGRQANTDKFGVGVSPGKVSDSQLRNHDNQKVCLSGQVRYVGCSVETICLGSNFLYDIVVDDLESR